MKRIDSWGTAVLQWGLPCLLAIACGCHSFGPSTIPRDRYDYSSAIGESWKRQALLNIVKLRYLDPPIFVDVGQIVAGYTLETSLNVGGQISSEGAIQGNSLLLGGAGKYTDRPTVTYTPLTGNKFVKSLMMPLPPESVFFMIQSGWPADSVLFSAVSAMNGLKNQETSLTGVAPPDPSFLRVLELMRKIQLSGAVGFRIKQDAAKQQTMLVTFRASDLTPETIADIAEIRRLLRLNADAQEFKLVFGATAANDGEVAVLTRSIMHIMGMMASSVDVPAEQVAAGRATPGASPTLHIGCSKKCPADAFVAVAYRNQWFWIDDRDLKTKRAFAFMMMLFTLADSGEKENLPLITIPAQ